jgi:mannose-6-phosphate isomerase-like protein (cupin superfamily)
MFVIERTDLPMAPFPELTGKKYGADVSLILVSTALDGAGPALHQHPYTEVFVLHTGEARFTIGDRRLIGKAGQVLVVPPFTPHRFEKTGSRRLEMTDIHNSPKFITEWL